MNIMAHSLCYVYSHMILKCRVQNLKDIQDEAATAAGHSDICSGSPQANITLTAPDGTIILIWIWKWTRQCETTLKACMILNDTGIWRCAVLQNNNQWQNWSRLWGATHPAVHAKEKLAHFMTWKNILLMGSQIKTWTLNSQVYWKVVLAVMRWCNIICILVVHGLYTPLIHSIASSEDTLDSKVSYSLQITPALNPVYIANYSTSNKS